MHSSINPIPLSGVRSLQSVKARVGYLAGAWSICCVLLILACTSLFSLYGMRVTADALFISASLLEAVLFVVLVRNVRNVLALVFFIYVYLVFIVGYPILNPGFDREGEILYFIVVASFLVGRHLGAIPMGLTPRMRVSHQDTELTFGARSILWLGITLKLGSLSYLLLTVGPVQFYSGTFMADKIEMYTAQSYSYMFLLIAQFGGVVACVAGVAAYVQAKQYRTMLFAMVLIGIPLISLDRSSVIVGLVAFLYIYRDKVRIRHLTIGACLALTVAVIVGNIRERSLGAVEQLGPLQAVLGELSVVEDVHLIVYTIDEQGISYGRQLFGPLLTMPIPRALYPNKPKHTGEVIMETYFPEEAAAGFFNAPTIFGDWLYNFGYPGLYFICLAIGYLVALIERSEISSAGVVISFFFFSLLRDNFSQAGAFIFVTILAAYIAKSIRFERMHRELSFIFPKSLIP